MYTKENMRIGTKAAYIRKTMNLVLTGSPFGEKADLGFTGVKLPIMDFEEEVEAEDPPEMSEVDLDGYSPSEEDPVEEPMPEYEDEVP